MEKKKKKEKKSLQDLYLHPKLSLGLVPYRLFYRIGIACRKMVYYIDFSYARGVYVRVYTVNVSSA